MGSETRDTPSESRQSMRPLEPGPFQSPPRVFPDLHALLASQNGAPVHRNASRSDGAATMPLSSSKTPAPRPLGIDTSTGEAERFAEQVLLRRNAATASREMRNAGDGFRQMSRPSSPVRKPDLWKQRLDHLEPDHLGTASGECTSHELDTDAWSGRQLLRALLVQQSQHERRLKKLLERHRQQVTSAVSRTVDVKLRHMDERFHVNVSLTGAEGRGGYECGKGGRSNNHTLHDATRDTMPSGLASVPEVVITRENEIAHKLLNGHGSDTQAQADEADKQKASKTSHEKYLSGLRRYLSAKRDSVDSMIRPSPSQVSFVDSPQEEHRVSTHGQEASLGPRAAARPSVASTPASRSRPSMYRNMEIKVPRILSTPELRSTMSGDVQDSNAENDKSLGRRMTKIDGTSSPAILSRQTINYDEEQIAAAHIQTETGHQIQQVMTEIGRKDNFSFARLSGLNFPSWNMTDSMAKMTTSQWMLQIIRSRYFDFFIAGLILFNAAVIGAQSNWAIGNGQKELPDQYRILNIVFTVAFTIEIVMRISAEGTGFLSCRNKQIRWNMFDLLLVTCSHAEWILNMFGEEVGIGVIRVIRTLRLVRVIRIVRVMRFFRDLQQMVLGIIFSLKSLMWCLLLLLLIMFLVAVVILHVLTEELEKNPDSEVFSDGVFEHFNSLMSCIFTLYMSITGGVDWGFDVIVPLMSSLPESSSIIIAGLWAVWIAFAVFCVLNIVTGVFVENSNKLALANGDHVIIEELASRRSWYEEVQPAFLEADTDGTGELDWNQFKATIRNPDVRKFFCRAGLDVDTNSSLRGLFHLLDFDGNGSVGVDELYIGGSQLLGPARALDVARLRHENWTTQRRMIDLWNLCVTYFDSNSQDPQAVEHQSQNQKLMRLDEVDMGHSMTGCESFQSAQLGEASMGASSMNLSLPRGASILSQQCTRSSPISMSMTEEEYKRLDRARMRAQISKKTVCPGGALPSLESSMVSMNSLRSPRPPQNLPGAVSHAAASPASIQPTTESNLLLQPISEQSGKLPSTG